MLRKRRRRIALRLALGLAVAAVAAPGAAAYPAERGVVGSTPAAKLPLGADKPVERTIPVSIVRADAPSAGLAWDATAVGLLAGSLAAVLGLAGALGLRRKDDVSPSF